ncbi:hypothetical protein GS504_01360 [Rhodococcus hoagii]|nr:hypothetical protein [Prescottella equi]NKS71679.1 hypothetical protein [Prescottella equi]
MHEQAFTIESHPEFADRAVVRTTGPATGHGTVGIKRNTDGLNWDVYVQFPGNTPDPLTVFGVAYLGFEEFRLVRDGHTAEHGHHGQFHRQDKFGRPLSTAARRVVTPLCSVIAAEFARSDHLRRALRAVLDRELQRADIEFRDVVTAYRYRRRALLAEIAAAAAP